MTRQILSRMRGQSEFFYTFNMQDDRAKGRCMLLVNTLLSTILNVFTTGIFYTGFLAANGIDIVNVGIISFIPYIAWGFSLFSPMILSRFKKRRALLIFNSFFYHITITLGVTLIPVFIKDSGSRTIAFAILVFAGNLCNALLGSGATAWHINFLPANIRNSFFSYNNIISAVSSAVTAIFSCLLADRLAGSPYQGVILSTLRYVAFVIIAVDILLLYLVPKEYPYNQSEKISLQDVFIVPMRNRKFLLTALIGFAWSAFANMNANTWNYYLLNDLGYSYLMVYSSTFCLAFFSIFAMKFWKKMISRYGWFNMLMVGFLCVVVIEFAYSFTTASNKVYYVLLGLINGFGYSGLNLTYASLFYVNLPEKDQDLFTVFWNCFCNIFVLIGSSVGTWFISLTNGHVWNVLGFPFYGSNFLPWIKGVLVFLIAVYIFFMKGRLDPESDYYDRLAEKKALKRAGQKS